MIPKFRITQLELDPHLSPAFTHARPPQGLKICEGSSFCHPVLRRVSHHGHLADSVAPFAAHPGGLRGLSGEPLAAFNTRIGDSLERPIRCCCYWWRCVRAPYRVFKLERFRRRRTWWLRGCHQGGSTWSQGAFGFLSLAILCFTLVPSPRYSPDRMYREAWGPWWDVLERRLHSL